jgi:hypothetical protein
MFKAIFASLVACISMQTGAYMHRFPTYDPQYIFDGQYTAALQQHAQHWRLLPLRGEQVDVTENCRNSASVPAGLWYVSQDSDGKLQLVAPSVTTLPEGFPDHVALRACGEQSSAQAALFVPATALEWIAANAGTVLIDD